MSHLPPKPPERIAPAEIRCCVDRHLPPGRLAEAAAVARSENAGNVPSAIQLAAFNPAVKPIRPAHMALLADRRWAPGRVLRVRFLGGTATQRKTLMGHAEEWSRYASVTFRQVPRGPAEIRAGFNPGWGSWSYLGTDSLLVPQDQLTLNIGWEPDQAVCLHELGHALGCVHEHQHPASSIPWNRPAVYAYYHATQGWTRQQVDQQVFTLYGRGQTNYSAYDPRSIMHYPLDPRLLTDPRRAVGWNTGLSAMDRSYIAQVYPGAGVAS